MKTFTKFFAFLFAFMLLGSISVNAQPWTAPSGDPSAPLMEIYVYGAMTPQGGLVNGDQIGAFDGTKLVGLLTVNGITSPSTTIDFTNWISNRLVVYSKDLSGNKLYEPGHPILLKSYKVAGASTNYAYTWAADPSGTAKQIDFHNIWYAPTGDSTGFVNQGPFFPAKGANSYCYVDLDFSATAPDNLTTLDFTVTDIAAAPIPDVLISSGGYSGTTILGLVSIPVYTVSGKTYNYTFTLTHATYDSEVITVTGTGPVGATTIIVPTIVLNSYGSVAGNIEFDPVTGANAPAFGAVISVSIGDSTYYDWADVNGNYLIEEIPDGGPYDFTVTYPGYTTGTFTQSIVGNGSTSTANDLTLIPLQGTVSGKIYDATNLHPVSTEFIYLKLINENGLLVYTSAKTTATGTYTISHNAGTYTLVIVDSLGGAHPGHLVADYKTLTVEDYVLHATTATENFNLLPVGETALFEVVTGNPNKLWSIHIESAKFGTNSLLPYDELAIFDTVALGAADDILVGSLQFDRAATWQNSGSNVLKAFAQFSNGDPGFTPGNGIQFRGYDVSHGNGDTTDVPLSWSFNANMGTYHGTTFPDPNTNPISYLTINWSFPSGSMIGTTVIHGTTTPIANVTVNVLNVFTHELVGTTTTNADGQFIIGLDQGTYDVKFIADGYSTDSIGDKTVALGEVTDLGNIELFERAEVAQSFSFDGPGFFFIGRSVEVALPADRDMLYLLNLNGVPSDFESLRHGSWVENDNVFDAVPVDEQLYYTGGAWTPLVYDWERLRGYQLFLEDDYAFGWLVAPVVEPEDNPIELDKAGFFYVPYFPYNHATPDDAITAFASILDSIDWVMDQSGNRLHKDNGNWIDNIGTLSPKEGYKIKTHHSVTFTYPAEATKSPRSNREMLNPVHFIYNEGNAADWTYTMYINTNEFAIGDEIAAYSNGIMVGSMVIDTEDAWENDLNTFYAAVEGGYETNTPIELMAWDASDGDEYTVGFEMVAINDNAYIGSMYPAGLDHFSYVNVYRGIVRVDENQIDNHVKVYPNPTNGTLNIESVSNINELRIYNVYGALVAVTNVNAKQQSVDVSNYTPGTYLVQLHTDTGVITKRVVVR